VVTTTIPGGFYFGQLPQTLAARGIAVALRPPVVLNNCIVNPLQPLLRKGDWRTASATAFDNYIVKSLKPSQGAG